MGLLSNWLLRREFGGCHIKNAQRCWNKVQNQNGVALGVRGGFNGLQYEITGIIKALFFWTDYTSEAHVRRFIIRRRRVLGSCAIRRQSHM